MIITLWLTDPTSTNQQECWNLNASVLIKLILWNVDVKPHIYRGYIVYTLHVPIM